MNEEKQALAEQARHRKAERLAREARLVTHAKQNPDVTATDLAVLFDVPKATAQRLKNTARRTK